MLTYTLENSFVTELAVTYQCDETGAYLGNETTPHALNGTLQIIVPLAMTNGEVDNDGIVYLKFTDSAINADNMTYDNPLGLEYLLQATKNVFVETFTQTELTRIKYDPAVTPEFVRPDKFIFATVCEGCTGDFILKPKLKLLLYFLTYRIT